jgi:hypothetical protein
VGQEALLLPEVLIFVARLENPKAVHFSKAGRDLDDVVTPRWIHPPVLNGSLRNKHVEPQSTDEMGASYLRAVHVIPRDLHLGRPLGQWPT